MALETLTFDHASDGTDSPLLIMGAGSNYLVTAFNAPAPSPKLLWGSSSDTDGARRADPGSYDNRTLTITLEALDASGSSTHEDALRGKIGKIHRVGGTLRWVRKDGSIRVFDLLASDSYALTIDVKYENGRAEVTVSFVALPRARGTSTTAADRVETTLPALVATETGITGDLTATGVWTVDNDAASDWWGLLWGIEQNTDYTFTDSTGSGALFYEAESRLPLGGSATAVSPSGASGAGSNVMRQAALSTTPVAIVSTASSAGVHLTHVGEFQIFARVHVPTTNAGTVTVAFEYGTGDFRKFTRNPERHSIGRDRAGTFRLLNLGYVTIPKVLTGPQRWEGRIVASSTVAGDDIDIDCMLLMPSAEGWGNVRAVTRLLTPTTFSLRDEFDQTAGSLTGKTLPVTGTWAGAGNATDFTVETTGKTAQRTAVSDAGGSPVGTGRWVRAGSAMTNTQVQLDYKRSANPSGSVLVQAVFARYVDTSNFVMVYVNAGTIPATINWVVNVAGTVTDGDANANLVTLTETVGSWYTVRLGVDTSGRITVWWGPKGNVSNTPIFQAQHTAAATGGTLASGTCGFYDANLSSTAITRNYDNFAAWVPVADAAVFAGRSIQIRSDSVQRQDSTGTYFQDTSAFEGELLRLPPAGAEARSTRMIAKPIYHREDTEGGAWIDSRIDDLSGRVTYTPGYL